MFVTTTKDYLIYHPTEAEIAEAHSLVTGRVWAGTVNADNEIYGYFAEFAFKHYYGVEKIGEKHGFHHVGLDGSEQRWDFIHNTSGLTIDVKAKPRDLFPPPIDWDCGYMKLPSKVWGKSDWLVFAGVTKDKESPTVALIGRAKTKRFIETARYHKEGTIIPNMYGPLKHPMYEKKYNEVVRMPPPIPIPIQMPLSQG
jgi:hypothetical protein